MQVGPREVEIANVSCVVNLAGLRKLQQVTHWRGQPRLLRRPTDDAIDSAVTQD